MYFERTVEFNVDIEDFDVCDILEQARSIIWSSKECDKADIERFKQDIDFYSLDHVQDGIYAMDRDKFEELYEIIINDYKYLTMDKQCQNES